MACIYLISRWWLKHVASVTKVNVDSNTVGWYQTTHLGQSENSEETVEVQISIWQYGMNGTDY